jgi:hypothetical protein
LIFGIIEVGLLMLSRSSMADSVASSARAGAIAANDADADLAILDRLRATLPSGGTGLRYVIVYKAAALLDREPPAACRASAETDGPGVAGCNIYQRPMALTPIRPLFGYDASTNPTATADQNWPARSRQSGYTAGSDLLGVFVSIDYRGISGVIGRHRWTSNAVLQLEARGA